MKNKSRDTHEHIAFAPLLVLVLLHFFFSGCRRGGSRLRRCSRRGDGPRNRRLRRLGRPSRISRRIVQRLPLLAKAADEALCKFRRLLGGLQLGRRRRRTSRRSRGEGGEEEVDLGGPNRLRRHRRHRPCPRNLSGGAVVCRPHLTKPRHGAAYWAHVHAHTTLHVLFTGLYGANIHVFS